MEYTVIGKLCEALLQAYRDRGQDLSAELLPGLSRAEIATRVSWFPAPLPEPLLELYGWRNGQPEDAWSTERVLWFRDMQFTSLERAQEEYQSMMDSYGVGNSREAEGIELRTSFPFASFNGGWYVIPCASHDLDPRHAFPVVSVFQGIDVYFHSIERMLETCIDWRLASKLVNDDWELDEDRERTIWCHHNPGIFGSAV
jgi:hypothetical protein